MRRTLRFWALYLIVGGTAFVILSLLLVRQYGAYDRATDPVEQEVGIASDDLIIFVDGKRENSGDGKSWETAVKTVGEAFGKIKTGSGTNRFIKIAENLDDQGQPVPYYTDTQLDLIESSAIQYDFNLTIEGGYRKIDGSFENTPTGEKENTIISGNKTHRLFAFKQSNFQGGNKIVFKQLTLTKGFANDSMGGGAIYAENLSVEVNKVNINDSVHNSSVRGGGAIDFFNTNATIQNSEFLSNYSSKGSASAAYLSSYNLVVDNKMTIADSIFMSNYVNVTSSDLISPVVYLEGHNRTHGEIMGNKFQSNATGENKGSAIIHAENSHTLATVRISDNHFISNGGTEMNYIIYLNKVGKNSRDFREIKKYSVSNNFFLSNQSKSIITMGTTLPTVIYNSFSNNIIVGNKIYGSAIINSGGRMIPVLINNTFSQNVFVEGVSNQSIFRIATANNETSGNFLVAVNNLIADTAIGENNYGYPDYYFYRYIFNPDNGNEVVPSREIDIIQPEICKSNLFPIRFGIEPSEVITKKGMRANYDFQHRCTVSTTGPNFSQPYEQIQFLDICENCQRPTSFALEPDAIYNINGKWVEKLNENIDRGSNKVTMLGYSEQDFSLLFNTDFLGNARFVNNDTNPDTVIDIGAIELQALTQKATMRSLSSSVSGQASFKLKIKVKDEKGETVHQGELTQGRKGYYLLPAEWELRSLFIKEGGKNHVIYLRPYGSLTQKIVISGTGLPSNYHTQKNTDHHSGDINKDGTIGLDDLNVILMNFAKLVGEFQDPDDKGDLNGEYIVDLIDLTMLLNSFARTGVEWPND